MSGAKIKSKVALYIGDARITDCIYDSGEVVNGFALLMKGTELYVYNATTGEFKFKLNNVKNARYSNETLIVTSSWGTKGVYDFKSRNLIPVIYKEIINRGLYFAVKKDDEDISIVYKREEGKENAKIIIPESKKITEVKLCNEGIIVCNTNKKYGVYSYEGEELIPLKYQRIQPFGYSYIVSGEDNEEKYEVYTELGQKALDDIFTGYSLDLPLVFFYKNGNVCAYNLYTKKLVAELKYKRIAKYDNVLAVSEDHQSYYIYSAEDGKLLLDFPLNRIYEHRHKVLRIGTMDEKNLFYLSAVNKTVNADTCEVKYKGGKYYIRPDFKDKILKNDELWEFFAEDENYI